MNEMEIRQQERQRMKEVFDNAEAQGREQIANKMLVTTDLSSSQIIEILRICLNSRLFHLLKKLWLRFLTLKLLFQVRKPPKM